MSSSGLELAVSYALPPSRLGFCGPQEECNRQLLVGFAKGQNISQSKVRCVLEKFEAMYPYLCLIAGCNGIADPFDEKVVKAFWVGNGLLDKVGTEDLRRLITSDFSGPQLLLGEEAKRWASQVVEGMVPHHSFHVLFLGSITGRVKFTNALRDLCRIGWGRVIGMRHEAGGMRQELTVRYKPLVFDNRVRLGEEVEKEIEWDAEIIPGVKVGLPAEALAKEGGWVSFHWGQVCDILSEEDIANLGHYTKKTISGLNRA